MAKINTLEFSVDYKTIIDEKFTVESITTVLDKAGAITTGVFNEIKYPQVATSGYGDYSDEKGYATGSASTKFKTTSANYDRSRSFRIATTDNQDFFNKLIDETIKHFVSFKAVPELDAFTFATLAGKEKVKKSGDVVILKDEDIIDLIADIAIHMDNESVPFSDRVLFMRSDLQIRLSKLDTYKNQSILGMFSKIIPVPQTRFYSKIDLFSGAKNSDGTDGEEYDGGYRKNATGKSILLFGIPNSSVIKYKLHSVSQIFEPDKDADVYTVPLRTVAIVDLYNNKESASYLITEKDV